MLNGVYILQRKHDTGKTRTLKRLIEILNSKGFECKRLIGKDPEKGGWRYSGKWYYIEKGVMSSKTLFVSHNGKQYYVKACVAQTGLSGAVSFNGKTYYLNKGVLTN